jgi:hypothetical protein
MLPKFPIDQDDVIREAAGLVLGSFPSGSDYELGIIKLAMRLCGATTDEVTRAMAEEVAWNRN